MTYTKEKFRITGLDCPDCSAKLEAKLAGEVGVTDCRIDFMSRKVSIEYDRDILSFSDIQQKIRNSGYDSEEEVSYVTTKIFVREMDSPNESSEIERFLRQQSGIREVSSNLIDHIVTVKHTLLADEVVAFIDSLGFAGQIAEIDQGKVRAIGKKFHSEITVYLSGIFAITGSVLLYFQISPIVSISILLCGMVIGGFSIAKKGLKELATMTLGMNFLMSLAIIGAVIIGEWSEAAMVVFLFALANYLENRSVDRARRSIESLMDLTPQQVHVKRGKTVETVPVEEISVGDMILVKPSERIPLDGVIRHGFSTIDQSPITGESYPVAKEVGSQVLAGTLNQNGLLEIEVTGPAGETYLDRIILLIEEAQARKAPSQYFIEKFARYYTPVVVLISVFVAFLPPLISGAELREWVYRALVLLVISCPCAFVISTPVSIVSGLSNAARKGILIKGGLYLENFSRITAMAFDKTGTLTTGQLSIEKIITSDGLTEDEVLVLAGAIESRSEHHIGRTICHEARKRAVREVTIEEFEVFPGRGVYAKVEGKDYFLGNHRLLEENGVCHSDVHQQLHDLERQGFTTVVLMDKKAVMAIFCIGDTPRSHAGAVVHALRERGLTSLIMLTGDNRNTAKTIAGEIGIDEIYAELLPTDKVDKIDALLSKHHSVAMVGDGINDAPALARASIGISMGHGATDVALETADIAIMSDNLNKLVELRDLSSSVLTIIKQNIFIALFLKAIFFALALFGMATLWMAVFADMGASLLVILNGLRVLR